MDYSEILKEPLFWLFTTAGSVALSVIGNLVTPFVQRLLALFSDSRGRALRAKNEEALLAVVAMQGSGVFRTSWKLDALMESIHGVGIILVSLAISQLVFVLPLENLIYVACPLLVLGIIFGYRKVQHGISKSNLAALADRRTTHMLKLFRRHMSALQTLEPGSASSVDPTDEEMRKWDEQHFGVSSETLKNRPILEQFITYV
ncbi:MAG: hypothetical protein QOH06_852 [Acidobacteriota bacterium]|jgi:hypothetical protein|nr:hypothetical protein [Acidobacteriota bacterium]